MHPLRPRLAGFGRRAALAAGLALTLGSALVQAFPVKPVTLLVPYPAGGLSDVIARLVEKPLAKSAGQLVIVDNLRRAGGAIAAQKCQTPMSTARTSGAAAGAVLPPLSLKLIERGHLFIARPPLYRTHAPARGKRPAAKIYALDDGELAAALDKLRKEGAKEGSWTISRFKGLGEMNAEQLWDTPLNPETRRLLPVSWLASGAYGEAGFDATAALLTKLMGKGEAASRRELMELHGDAVEVDV